jgi:epoxyqueuosine reductase
VNGGTIRVMKPRQEELRRRLVALGFDEVRFARMADVPAAGFTDWLERGFQADMAWMERTAAKRLQPELVLPGARSVIMLGVNYWPGEAGERRQPTAESPVWARYSRYEDYHETIKPALMAAGRVIEELFGVQGNDYRYYADTGPVLERGWAERAGLGFLGKNGMLISRQFGNWLLLAAILTRLELEADEPLRARIPPAAISERTGLLCGKCVRCVAACPTQAIPEPGLVDARRCISYQTIENKGLIPRDLRPGVGDHVYGCDVCLEVCPWNRFARAGRRMLLAARFEIAALTLRELLELTAGRFAEVFCRTPVKRLKLTGLLRNACVVAGNVAAQAGAAHELVAPLQRLAAHPAPMVRAHAVWALRQIAGAGAPGLLAAARANETDLAVMAEYDGAGRPSGVAES